MSGVLDQIVFAWAEENLLRREDFGPVATSLERAREGELLFGWDYRLAARADVRGSGGERPLRSMCYWADGESAAVLYRMASTAGSSGSRPGTRTRALVGASHDLTPRRALALHDRFWLGSPRIDADPAWERRGFGLPRVRLDELTDEIETGVQDLDRAARRCPAELSRLVAAALRAPTQPYSVVGAQADVYALLWGMLDVLDKVLDGPWTFSTYETSHEGERMPRVVFLPHWPMSSFREVDREPVDLADTSEDDCSKAADLLVDVYTERGQAGVARMLADAGVDSDQDSVTRVRQVLTYRGRVGPALPPPERVPPTVLEPAADPVRVPVAVHSDPLLDQGTEPDWSPVVAQLSNEVSELPPDAYAELLRRLAEQGRAVDGSPQGQAPPASAKARRKLTDLPRTLFDGRWMPAEYRPELVPFLILVAILVLVWVLAE
jgi:hypothetical protein